MLLDPNKRVGPFTADDEGVRGLDALSRAWMVRGERSIARVENLEGDRGSGMLRRDANESDVVLIDSRELECALNLAVIDEYSANAAGSPAEA